MTNGHCTRLITVIVDSLKKQTINLAANQCRLTWNYNCRMVEIVGIVTGRNNSWRCNVKINGCIAKTIQIRHIRSSWRYSGWYRSNTPYMTQYFFVINSVGIAKLVNLDWWRWWIRLRETYRIELLDNSTNKWESFGEAGCHRTCNTSSWMLFVKNRSSKLWDLKFKLRKINNWLSEQQLIVSHPIEQKVLRIHFNNPIIHTCR